MRRIEVVIALLALMGWALLISFFLVLRTMDMPNVVTCLETDNPAMSVEVTSNRLGHVVERNVLGCKVYWYEGRR